MFWQILLDNIYIAGINWWYIVRGHTLYKPCMPKRNIALLKGRLPSRRTLARLRLSVGVAHAQSPPPTAAKASITPGHPISPYYVITPAGECHINASADLLSRLLRRQQSRQQDCACANHVAYSNAVEAFLHNKLIGRREPGMLLADGSRRLSDNPAVLAGVTRCRLSSLFVLFRAGLGGFGRHISPGAVRPAGAGFTLQPLTMSKTPRIIAC